MSVDYTAQGLLRHDSSTNESAVSSFTIDLDNTASVSLVVAQFAFSTETSNGNARIEAMNSTAVSDVRYKTWTHSTTSSFGSQNSTQIVTNYWDLGALATDSFTGEWMRCMIWIHNSSIGYSLSPAMNAVTIYGQTSYEQSNGVMAHALFNAKLLDDHEITGLRFKPLSGNIAWHRAVSWSMADG